MKRSESSFILQSLNFMMNDCTRISAMGSLGSRAPAVQSIRRIYKANKNNSMTKTLGGYMLAVVTAVAMVISLFAVALPASADVNGDVRIRTNNTASISNSVSATADSGDNFAGGSFGGDGDDGGDADNDEGGGNTATGGNGGNGGNGGEGGLVTTGNATANAGIANLVNSSEVEVGDDSGNVNGDVRVRTRNNTTLGNAAAATADSGDSFAGGSFGGDGEEGGEADNEDGGGNTAEGGAGGAGGAGNVGGTVQTGHAESNAGVLNVLNRSVVRVR